MFGFNCSRMHSVLCLFLIFIAGAASGQSDSVVTAKREKIYQVTLKYELPASVLALGTSYFGFAALDRTSAYNASDVAHLNPGNVNGFDRPVIFSNPAYFTKAQEYSDLFLNISILSPLLLAADKQIRKDWLDLITMYLVSHTVDNAIYFAAAFPVRRTRPYVYNTDIPLEQKVGIAKSNSFFSGHVSFAATSTFFFAKVFTDYHQIKGLKRAAIYTAAAIPPSLVGYYRMRAGKHFRTDVLLGLVIGAGSGIFVPEFHRRLKKNNRVSVSPFYGTENSGLTVSLKL
ncbi:phosphatase PAP2 family protein [Chitinophaga lutea]|uniref:Phosphatase PAP2 family protein n=2 Tax=Chitinophaga lutea TaxID=2488634 RepID=A0A3N4PN42_9BACT|nr:phosphatase PAP2 family protein [Chitinophaga lutea]